jgi:hypothetical protein
MDFQLEGVPPEELARLLEMVPQVAIPPSQLVGVVAVAQVAEASGVAVEMLAIEVREAGALACEAFLASSFRESDPALATGCPIDITQSAGFDLWTGLPHGRVYERYCPGSPTGIHDPLPPDMQGRRAVSLPDAFPVAWTGGLLVSAAALVLRNRRLAS